MPANPLLSVVCDTSGRQLRAMFVRQNGGHSYACPTMASRRRLAASTACLSMMETRLGVSYVVRKLTVAQAKGGM